MELSRPRAGGALWEARVHLSSDETKGVHLSSCETQGVHLSSDETQGAHPSSDDTQGLHFRTDETQGAHPQVCQGGRCKPCPVVHYEYLKKIKYAKQIHANITILV